jgi:TolB-like protein/DNA-binding winged helix-turn-helix (wHTH) protein
MEQGVSFGRHRFDLETGRLWSGKREVKLTPKASAVLKVLLTHAGQPVLKEELFASVWRATVVSDDALTSCIQELRRALADNAKQPRFIETRHRRGYRFIARLAKPATKISAGSDGASEVGRPAAGGLDLDALLTNRQLPSSLLPAEQRWVHGDRSDQALCAPGCLPTRRASIAVMPFQALPSGERGLADGLSYDITVGLAKLRSLLVIAQGTTFALRDRGVRGSEAATLLGVNYVATGVVRRDGPSIRVSLQLCDHESGRLLWTDEHEVRGDDAFQVPGIIAARIVSCLEAEIRLAESNRAIIRPPNSLDAWEAHHRALWHMYRFTEPDNDEAQRLFQRAIAWDPTFSRPYAGLSFTHWQNAFTFRPAERQVEADRAFDAAGRGLQADPRDPAGHWAMGRALWLRNDDAASLSALDDAVSLSPSFAIAHYTRGFVEAQTGDAAAAVLASDFAQQLSPFDPMLYAMCCARAFALVRLGRYEEAAEWATRAARKPNAHVQAHGLSALVLAVAGKLDDALREVGIVRRLRPTYAIEDFFSSYRVVGSEERAYRIAARRIGLS